MIAAIIDVVLNAAPLRDGVLVELLTLFVTCFTSTHKR